MRSASGGRSPESTIARVIGDSDSVTGPDSDSQALSSKICGMPSAKAANGVRSSTVAAMSRNDRVLPPELSPEHGVSSSGRMSFNRNL